MSHADLFELLDPSLHIQPTFTVAEQCDFEEAAETERWGFCLRCGALGHYARECASVPAMCPEFKTTIGVQT